MCLPRTNGMPHREYPALFSVVKRMISAVLSVFLAAAAASTPAAWAPMMTILLGMF